MTPIRINGPIRDPVTTRIMMSQVRYSVVSSSGANSCTILNDFRPKWCFFKEIPSRYSTDVSIDHNKFFARVHVVYRKNKNGKTFDKKRSVCFIFISFMQHIAIKQTLTRCMQVSTISSPRLKRRNMSSCALLMPYSGYTMVLRSYFVLGHATLALPS